MTTAKMEKTVHTGKPSTWMQYVDDRHAEISTYIGLVKDLSIGLAISLADAP